MAPTITNGEPIRINYTAYMFSWPRRWDVAVVRAPGLSNVIVPKRIIALPLETVYLSATGIVINGKLVPVPSVVSNVVYCPPEKLPEPMRVGLLSFPYVVPSNHYFVVGDNWTNSLDSRMYGAVSENDILGKVIGK